ncbi:hypothetical protein BKA67DRAFT_540696 [Truncatella angustata]|uniref:Uncharacterized protein n=1 Tax=Truncatella angustata TaxID=152316 RepID=A0A9P8RJY7_9PEZI|nr:uncharacterized protein BKA67DRAFT_540696 [Truncatella angustata]KAH6647247.1 hypothetical protein BKA67DRAFT_540696 [Truncatella angustata]
MINRVCLVLLQIQERQTCESAFGLDGGARVDSQDGVNNRIRLQRSRKKIKVVGIQLLGKPTDGLDGKRARDAESFSQTWTQAGAIFSHQMSDNEKDQPKKKKGRRPRAWAILRRRSGSIESYTTDACATVMGVAEMVQWYLDPKLMAFVG